MRFIENGPDIPDELLTARDEGRVVLFCGAGVSRARANLPDFFGLANKVIHSLGVPLDHPVFTILEESKRIQKSTGVQGLIPVDRIFGLLERDFRVSDIELAVSEQLRPSENVDLSAHRILLDLATTREGKVRLVTTNFDRLFELCDSSLTAIHPPSLPDPSIQPEMDGVVYLHGSTSKDYKGTDSGHFILSSSEFGRAYLSEGWAATFFREILDRYIVVFVGYSADDPPVQYLLEALNKRKDKLTGVYAFQSGGSNYASAIWEHKGVEAITYEDNGEHRALWDTLERWAERAKDPENWSQSIIELARKGPVLLQSYERGQVASLISSLDGARRFSEAVPPPPAEWLCTFDAYRRYSLPSITSTQEYYIDPFDWYGIDCDIVPNNIDPSDYNVKREVPELAWDAFSLNRLDRQNFLEGAMSGLRGHWASNIPVLSPRLKLLGEWISRVANQPATVWWVSHQHGIHPDIVRGIKWQLAHSSIEISEVIRQAWAIIFEVNQEKNHDFHHDWFDLKSVVKKNGWDGATVRNLADINRPYKAIQTSFYGKSIPPNNFKELRINDLFSIDIKYPDYLEDMDIPEEWLISIIREFRKNLELALQMETEIGGYGLTSISPIVEDRSDASIERHSRLYGLSGSVILFTSLFSRLVDYDITLARQEFSAWFVDDATIFSRLRIWSCGNTKLVPIKLMDQIILGLSNKVFWDSYHQRDLLIVISGRWNDLLDSTKKGIEERLLSGGEKWEDEEDEEFIERRAWGILNRLVWLADNGCSFSFNLDTEIGRLQNIATKWKPSHADKAIESMEGRGGVVRTDSEYSALLQGPISTIISRSKQLSGRNEDFLVEKDPFSGLSGDYPIRAFSALTDAARQGEFPEWAWRKFLNTELRNSDPPRLSTLISERIIKYPDKAIRELITPISGWLLKVSQQLSFSAPNTFDKIIPKLVNILQTDSTDGASSIVRGNNKPEWVMEAINSSAGKLAEAVFEDPRRNGLKVDAGFPAEWGAHIDNLLSLGGDHRRYVLVIFSLHLDWFYQIDSSWVEVNLLSILDEDDDDNKNAFWDGFFWGARVPNRKLYVRIKDNLLSYAKMGDKSLRGPNERLAGIILAGWGSIDSDTGKRLVSNVEFRDVLLQVDDEFRSKILWQLTRWVEIKVEEQNLRWTEMLPEFLRDVWPRQKIVRTARTSTSLFELAFSNADTFQEIAELILPLLITVNSEYLMLPELRKSKDNIVDIYPDQTLDLLYAILPENVTTWPHDIVDVLQRIGDAGAYLGSDEKLLELKRRWNAR